MESNFVAPEELASRFRSKMDLYKELTVDCKYSSQLKNFSRTISPIL